MSNIPSAGTPFVCAWSGGKDSCLAMYRAVTAGARPRALLAMLDESGERSRSHGLRLSVLRAQAEAQGLPLVTGSATWDDYERTFIRVLEGLQAAGVEAGVFGDIDLDPHREWEEKVCEAVGMKAFLPLWQGDRLALLEELLVAGFRAMIVTVKEDQLDREFLGKTIDRDLVEKLRAAGVDPCGENGEYHTLITDGPGFSAPLQLTTGDIFPNSGWLTLDVQLAKMDV
jgi:diphthine-ammonia ligase